MDFHLLFSQHIVHCVPFSMHFSGNSFQRYLGPDEKKLFINRISWAHTLKCLILSHHSLGKLSYKSEQCCSRKPYTEFSRIKLICGKSPVLRLESDGLTHCPMKIYCNSLHNIFCENEQFPAHFTWLHFIFLYTLNHFTLSIWFRKIPSILSDFFYFIRHFSNYFPLVFSLFIVRTQWLNQCEKWWWKELLLRLKPSITSLSG